MGILYALEGVRTPLLDAVMSALTQLGSETLVIAAALAVYWCFSKKHGYYLMAIGLIGTALNQFLKILCRVPRPWVRDPNFTIVEAARADAGGYSFPSGHTQGVTGSLGGIARLTKSTALRVVCIVLALVVAFSRMYLGVHYPSDVGFSLAVGIVLIFALYPVFEGLDEHPRRAELVFGITAVLSLAAALWVEFRAWPADIDADNLAEAVKTLNMMFGIAAAAAVGAPIERKHLRFEVAAPWWAQILKVALGIAGILGLRIALKPLLALVLGPLGIATAIRYGLLILFAILVWPRTFPWFAAGCPLKKKK